MQIPSLPISRPSISWPVHSLSHLLTSGVRICRPHCWHPGITDSIKLIDAILRVSPYHMLSLWPNLPSACLFSSSKISSPFSFTFSYTFYHKPLTDIFLNFLKLIIKILIHSNLSLFKPIICSTLNLLFNASLVY